jgi:hypothetical protein
MKNLSLQFWILLVVSIISGILIGLMDTSLNWDDTGITVSAIIIISFLTGLARPGFAWLWALIIGGCVFGFNFAMKENMESAVALVFSFAGAFTGFLVRRLFSFK